MMTYQYPKELTFKESDFINIIREICRHYYDEKTYAHALRVYNYIQNNPNVSYNERAFYEALALAHDLFKDTDCPRNLFSGSFEEALMLLTKPEDMDYNDYCYKLSCRDRPSMNKVQFAAWFVKIADIKDHLSQTETLTDELKDKYLKGLSFLL